MILDEKHEMLRKLFRQYAETEFTKEVIEELDTTGEFNRELFNKMARYGLTGAKIPVKYGGQGCDNLGGVLMGEEFARVCMVGSIYAGLSNSLGCGPLLIAGSEEQKQKYLPEIARGEKIMVFGLTEPGVGSDASSVATSAVLDGNEFILNGRKSFITGAPIADYIMVFARTDPKAKKAKGISAFIVDMKLPGVSCGAPEKKLGINGFPTSDVVFEDVRVPINCLLGRPNQGFAYAMLTLDGGRMAAASQAIGVAQGCLDACIQYVKERRQFGTEIGNFQAIRFMLADMATELAAARELVYNAAVMKDRNMEATMACSMAKYYAAEAANRIAYKAIQIHGGYGYVKDYPVERMFRDVRVTSIYEGTSQIQQTIIANELLK